MPLKAPPTTIPWRKPDGRRQAQWPASQRRRAAPVVTSSTVSTEEKSYHSTCGDPLGTKAKDAQIARLTEQCERMKERLTKISELVAVISPGNWRDIALHIERQAAIGDQQIPQEK